MHDLIHDLISSNGITITKNKFKIGNQMIFLNCGEIHYFRIHPDDWEDRLIKAKDMGLNAVLVDIPWNFHELESGEFDFQSKGKDVEHFFHLCENKSLYIIVKPGPWIGSDLINGGIPQWLIDDCPKIMALNNKEQPTDWSSKQAPPISYLSPTYLKYVERYIHELGYIIEKHLYPHGGVILIQVDNKISFGFNHELYDVDYNHISIEYYQQFLKDKYKDISELNLLYGQNYLVFESIRPPTTESYGNALQSDNEFTMKGEFLRLLDWMECKETIIQEFTRQVCYYFRKSRLTVPYFVNMEKDSSPMDIIKQNDAYKTGVAIGDNWYFNFNFNIDFDNPEGDNYLEGINFGDTLLEYRAEKLKSRLPHLPFISEFENGKEDKIISANHTQLMTRLALGHGMKALSYHTAIGGKTPTGIYQEKEFSYSALEESIGFDGEKFYTDTSGLSYDFQAPVGEKGQLNPRFEVVKLFSQYLSLNGTKLLESAKVYDDIAILNYYPYSRIKFNTQELGANLDYLKYSATYSDESKNSEYINLLYNLNKLGINYRIIDPELMSVEDMLKSRILIACFFDFMDSKSMEKIKTFVEKGGILLSFIDIPIKNEYLLPDHTLFKIYKATLDQEKSMDSIDFMEDKFSSFGSIYSYKFLKESYSENTFIAGELFGTDHIEESELLAYKIIENNQNVFGFQRSFELGKIFHLGFIPSTEDRGKEFLYKFLQFIGFTGKNTECNSDLRIIRQQSLDSEEFISLVNLHQADFENVSVTLKKTSNFRDNSDIVKIEDINIPARTALQWTLNKKLDDNLKILICTSEINNFKSIARIQPMEKIIEGYHFQRSRNLMELLFNRKPQRIVLNDMEIVGSNINDISNPDVSIIEADSPDGIKNLLFSVRYSKDFKLELSFGEEGEKGEEGNISEIYIFHFTERENFEE